MTKWQAKPVTDETIRWIGSQIGCDLQTGPWIAGGTPRLLWFDERWQGHDIDVFVPNVGTLNHLHDVLKKITGDPGYQTRNACTYGVFYGGFTHKIQLICKNFYPTLDKLFNYFDFTACKFATDGKLIVSDEKSVQQCQRRELVWNITSPQGISPYRVIKYSAYGFDVDNRILSELVKRYHDNPQQFNLDPDYE